MQNPAKMRKAQAEVDSVLSNGAMTVDQLKKLEYVTTYCHGCGYCSCTHICELNYVLNLLYTVLGGISVYC